MTWEPRPTPDVTPETEPFWEGAAEGRLLLKECLDCGLTFFYPRALCPDCLSDTEWLEASGSGRIYTYSVVHQISGWPDEHIPLIVAYVELEEGPRVFTNIVNADPSNVAIDDRVEVDFEPTEDPNVAIPVFRPAE